MMDLDKYKVLYKFPVGYDDENYDEKIDYYLYQDVSFYRPLKRISSRLETGKLTDTHDGSITPVIVEKKKDETVFYEIPDDMIPKERLD